MEQQEINLLFNKFGFIFKVKSEDIPSFNYFVLVL